MRNENQLVGACVEVLRHGVSLLERLDDSLYASAGPLPARSGVGVHVRHCVDFYRCLTEGFPAGRVDYNRRGRDPRIERDRAHALKEMQAALEDLDRLAFADGDTPLLVAPEGDGDAAGEEPAWCKSTLARELQFLLSHTIHHFALIALMLRLRGFEPGAEFGVNPSTLKHWREEEAVGLTHG